VEKFLPVHVISHSWKYQLLRAEGVSLNDYVTFLDQYDFKEDQKLMILHKESNIL